MEQLKAGQRWISESEPELGLGTLIESGHRRIKILFPAAAEYREYAIDNAPIKRVRFRAGDTIKTQNGTSLTVEAVRELGGLITYLGEGRELPEAQLSDTISFRRPEDRLLAGQVDEVVDFELRRRTLQNQHLSRKSPIRGFVGGRIDLIPHQLYIAHEVSLRQAPRVLLSDEVGLGKTIEACVILHRLLLTGRAARILVLVPESLVHQWFVEMLRRFNVWLNIFDEERCAAITAGQSDVNPFLDDQLILASISFLANSPTRSAQALAAGWDMLVVDEAHHLQWAPGRVSPEYALIEALSKQAEGLLLLTATPEQLGQESHFARLRLLDPDRYDDFQRFKGESGKYQLIAPIAEKLHTGKSLTKEDAHVIQELFAQDEERAAATLAALGSGDGAARERLLEDLLDLHGPGRVVFRNTRTTMSGFPRRKVQLIALRAREAHEQWLDRVSTEFALDAGASSLEVKYELKSDPRVQWLVGILEDLAPHKILLICRSKEKALSLVEALRLQINIKSSLFHEGLTLIERDRNAAYFAEEDGARLLICSEIGSEGRNFQFAHHLVLFDLPLNPELLEQRIGRLDRIGQTTDIQIQVPYLERSPQEVLSRWYHEGLNAFERSLEGANELFGQFGRQVHDLALEFPLADTREASAELATLLEETANARRALVRQLEEGRDRLLELNSFRPKTAQHLIEGIRREDREATLEEFMMDVFDHFGVHLEELAPRTYALNAEGVITDAFPSIPFEGIVATFDRKRALSREDVAFLTWDHPMVTGAMDLVLDSQTGNSTFAVLPDANDRALLIEALFVVEAVAEGRLHVDRFLPATPLRIIVNQKGEDVGHDYPERSFEKRLQKGSPYKLLDHPELVQKVLPAMIRAAHKSAERKAKAVSHESLRAMNQLLEHEIHRLRTLQKLNDHIRPQEIALAEKQQQKLAHAIQAAPVRLDSIRLIWKGPPGLLA